MRETETGKYSKKFKGESDSGNEKEKERSEERDARAKGRMRKTRVRPELDRIGELVITEAGDSPGTSTSLPRAST